MFPFAFIFAPFESSGQDLFVAGEYYGIATSNLAEIDDLFHLCCNRMASDLMRSQEWQPFHEYLSFCLHSCAIFESSG